MLSLKLYENVSNAHDKVIFAFVCGAAVDVLFLLADKKEFSGIYFQQDTLFYTGETNDYDTFNNFSDNSWAIPHSDIT